MDRTGEGGVPVLPLPWGSHFPPRGLCFAFCALSVQAVSSVGLGQLCCAATDTMGPNLSWGLQVLPFKRGDSQFGLVHSPCADLCPQLNFTWASSLLLEESH